MKSKWTIDTLKEHFEKLLEEKDRAIHIALSEVEKWRANANEWRGAMNDRERNFVTRRELWAAVVGIVGILGTIVTIVLTLIK